MYSRKNVASTRKKERKPHVGLWDSCCSANLSESLAEGGRNNANRLSDRVLKVLGGTLVRAEVEKKYIFDVSGSDKMFPSSSF